MSPEGEGGMVPPRAGKGGSGGSVGHSCPSPWSGDLQCPWGCWAAAGCGCGPAASGDVDFLWDEKRLALSAAFFLCLTFVSCLIKTGVLFSLGSGSVIADVCFTVTDTTFLPLASERLAQPGQGANLVF